MNDIGEMFMDTIIEPLANLGLYIDKLDVREVERIAAASIARLATLVGQPGYDMAVEAELDIVAIKAGLKMTSAMDVIDIRALGLIEGALRMGAGVMA